MFIARIEDYIPQNEYSNFVKEYFLWMHKKWTKEYIKNIDVDIKFIEIDDFLIPVSLWNHKDNCYTTSLLWLMRYWKYETKNISNLLVSYFYNFFLDFLIFIAKRNYIDDVVYVNNFLLSTNIYPDFSKDTLNKIHEFLKESYKNKIIIFRSLNNLNNNEIMNSLNTIWFRKMISRQIFIFENRYIDSYKKLKVVKNDFRIINKFGFSFKKIDISEAKVILDLYNMLYLDKYTYLNPQFTVGMIENLLHNKFFSFYKLEDNNKVIGIIWYYSLNNQSTAPIFWYDTSYNKRYNLYSQISNLLTFQSLNDCNTLNSSSWAWKFKMARGWEKYLEYNYLYIPSSVGFLKNMYFKFLFFIWNSILEKDLNNNIY